MEIFSLVGSILLNDNGVADKLRGIGSIGEKLGNTMSGVKEAFGAVGLAAAGYLASAVNSSTKFQQITADLQQTIKSTGGAAGYTADQIKAMAGALSQQTTFSTGEILKGQNMLLTFTNISGKVYKDASMAMLDLSQKMGTEPQQTAIQLGKALNDPIKGITALTRVGVTFTDQQKEQIKTMMAAKDTAGAQEVIIKELNKEFGGQASAQLNTYAGQMKLLSNNLGSMKVAIGNALLPYLQKFMEIVNKTLAPLISFVKAHGQLTAAVLGAVAAIGTLTGGLTVFHKVAEILGPTISGIIRGIAGLSAPIVIAIAAVVALYLAYQKNFGGIRDFLNGVFSKVANAFKVFQDNLKKGMSVPQALADAIGKAFGPKLGQQASTVFKTIQNVISEAFKEIQKVWNEVLKPTLDLLLKALQSILKWVSDNWGTISKVIGEVFQEIQSVYQNILKPILDILLKAMQDIVKWVSDNWRTISKVIETVFSAIKLAWEDVLKPVLDFLIQTFGQVLKWVDDNWPLISKTIGTVMNNIKNNIETVMNIIKPGWEAAWNIIKNVVPPIWDAIKTIISTLINQIEDIIKTVMDIINGNWGAAWKDIVKLVKDTFSGAVNIVKDVLNTIGGVFKGIATTALKWGSDMVDGIIKGIKSKVDDVGKAAGDVANKIKSFLHFSVPDEGPLTDYESWMPDFMEGLAKGIDSNKFKVTDKIKQLAADMKVDTTATITANKKGVQGSEVNSSKVNTAKQPILLQLILQNGKAIAEYLIDDINQLQGTMQLSNSRLNLGRR